MKLLSLSTLAACGLLSAIAVIPFQPATRKESNYYRLELQVASPSGGSLQAYFDLGAGFSEPASTRFAIPPGAVLQDVSLAVPLGTCRAIRFDPIDGPGTVTIAGLRLTDKTGQVLRKFAPADFQPVNEIAALRTEGERLIITVLPGNGDPQLLLTLSPPVKLGLPLRLLASDFFSSAGMVMAGLVAGLWVLGRSQRLRSAGARLGHGLVARPGWAVALIAATAVIASAYPVVFLGRSYVSPNFGPATLLYDKLPTLPGYRSGTAVDTKGSDVGAIIWQHIPYSMAQHEALFRDGELPWFNRYNSAGTPLLGQGQSMSGDPLHYLIVVPANGSAWAWDLKFLLAKWLFAAGLGLLVLTLTQHLPAALLVSFAAPFFGYFVYRINHPAIFSLCYSPWVLYCWIRAARAHGARAVAGWAALLALANWSVMSSGTVKEAYMLLLTMNLSGFCVFAAVPSTWPRRLLRIGGMAWGGLIFVLLTSPVWLTFLGTLENSYTTYDAASAYQIQPGMLLGAFDELFYRPLMTDLKVFNPSVNFVILLGVLYFLATLRLQWTDRTIGVLAASSLFPLAMAFGLVPERWIVLLPFLKNIAHVDNTFTCALIVLWSVLAGAGIKAAWNRLGSPDGRGDLAIAGILLFFLVFAWIASGQAVHRPTFGLDQTVTFIDSGHPLPVPPFIWVSLASLLAASTGLAFVARRSLVRRELGLAGGLFGATCLVVMIWRGALHDSGAGFEDYTVRPPHRVDFHAHSEAIEFVQAATKGAPARAIGVQGTLSPGWTGVYGIEGISGPDALMNPFYRELTGLGPVERIWGWRLYLSPEKVEASRPFLDFLNVRYYVDLPGNEKMLKAALTPKLSADLEVYESATAWPRAFFTDRMAVYAQPADLMQRIVLGDGRPFAAVQEGALPAAPLAPGSLEGRTVNPASNYRLTTNTTSFDITANGPGLAVLSEVYWPGNFRAEVDGKSARVIRVNHAFRGVAIEAAGPHRIMFRYELRNLNLILGLVSLGALLLAGSGWFVFLRRGSAIAAA